MCYNNCHHFRFNPMTGSSQCLRGKRACLEDVCPVCDQDECICEEGYDDGECYPERSID